MSESAKRQAQSAKGSIASPRSDAAAFEQFTGPRLVTDVQRKRVESVDVLRGIVMVIMALDHTRDYFGIFGTNPTDLSTASVPLFLTRWITHICAPTFFLLTGVGAGLASQTRSRGELAKYLVTRGLLLMLLEVTLMRCLAYQFNFDYQVTLLIVLWTLGCAMVFLGLILFLPVSVILAIGLVMIGGHNLLDGVQSTSALWVILHRPGFLSVEPPTVMHLYPLIPWVGVTAVGYGLAQVFTWDSERRRRFLLIAGLACVAGFILLRASNVYGDPRPWSAQDRGGIFTFLSFFNTTKQAPSLLFLLMTLGPSLLILWATERGVPSWLRPVINYGKAPFFYFFTHFAFIHLLAVIVTFAMHGSAHWMFESPSLDRFPFTPPPGWGFSLPVVYAVWLFVVAVLYIPCKKVAALKASRRYPWLSYL